MSEQLKPKEKTKFMQEVKESITRLGGLRQSFAWGAVQLFSGSGQPCVALNQPIKIANVPEFTFHLIAYLW